MRRRVYMHAHTRILGERIPLSPSSGESSGRLLAFLPLSFCLPPPPCTIGAPKRRRGSLRPAVSCVTPWRVHGTPRIRRSRRVTVIHRDRHPQRRLLFAVSSQKPWTTVIDSRANLSYLSCTLLLPLSLFLSLMVTWRLWINAPLVWTREPPLNPRTRVLDARNESEYEYSSLLLSNTLHHGLHSREESDKREKINVGTNPETVPLRFSFCSCKLYVLEVYLPRPPLLRWVLP